MNVELLAEFKVEEVWRALNQMHPTKSPRPNGMSLIFYQKHWDVVFWFMCYILCLRCLNNCTMPRGINETYMCLIPKVKHPQKITKFRPIGLCNMFYKIISKVLASRLKRTLSKVINESHSAFVPGRLITNNVLVTFETMHCIN